MCAAQMLAHADRALPNECVGFLAGVGMDVTFVIPLPNSRGSRSFFVEPYDQYLGEKRIKDARLKLIAIYHSHPGGCACLSETDLHFADRWDCIQVVIAISVPDRLSTQVRGYQVSSGQGATEVKVLIG
jgi:proteasome lid subunit RPN8/RPN11